MVMVKGSGVLLETTMLEDGSAHAKRTSGVVLEVEAPGELLQIKQVPEQQEVVSKGVVEEVVIGCDTGEDGVENLSLSSGDKEENLPSSGVNDGAEVSGYSEGRLEKRPQVAKDGG